LQASKESLDEVARKAFKIPTNYVVTVYLLVTAVVSIGVVLSIKYSDWLILARSGAVLILLAMACEITGLPEKYVNRIMKLVESVMAPVVLMQINRLPHVYGADSATNEEKIAEISEKELRRRVKDASDKFQKVLSARIKWHQFLIASLGTLLWAFADLIGKQ